MGVRASGTKPPRVVRAAAVGATVAILATGGWTMAGAAEPTQPPIQLPELGQTYVTSDAPHGFTSKDNKGAGITETSDALGAPPGGNADALVLKTPDAGSKATFFTGELAGPLSTFLSSSYYAKRDASSTGSDIQFPSFQIPVDKNGEDFVTGDYSTLTFEPIYQPEAVRNTTTGTWNKYNTGAGLFCSTQPIKGFEGKTKCENGGLKTLADIIAENEGITALGVGINQGSGNPEIVGGADLLQVGTTTYNFERKAPLPPVLPEPEPEEPNCDLPPPDDNNDPGGDPGGPPMNEHPGGEQPQHPGGGEHPQHPGGGQPMPEDPKSGHPAGEDPHQMHPGDGGEEHPGGMNPGDGDEGEHPGGEHPGGEEPPTPPVDECTS